MVERRQRPAAVGRLPREVAHAHLQPDDRYPAGADQPIANY
jgi:hypothetical protein